MNRQRQRADGPERPPRANSTDIDEVHEEAADHARTALERMLANVPAAPVPVKG